MNAKKFIAGMIMTLIAGVGGWFFFKGMQPTSNQLSLLFKAEINGQPLIYNDFAYNNPLGGQAFRIRDFRFFISHVELVGQSGAHKVVDSFHLARFDNADRSYSLDLAEVPLKQVKKVRLSIGVDQASNTSIEPKGDLDPNSQMAWNWTMGYKFVLLEGAIDLGEQVAPLVYHVGFSENLKEIEFELPKAMDLSSGGEINFLVDPMKIFTAKERVDMAKLSSVKFAKDDAKLLADNYAAMITLAD